YTLSLHDALPISVSEEQRLAASEAGGDARLVHGAPLLVRHQHHDDVGSARRVGHRADVEALVLRLEPGLAGRAQAHDHLGSGLFQVQGVGVSLAAVANHGDDPPREPGGIGVGVVKDAHVRRAHGCSSVIGSRVVVTSTARTPTILWNCWTTRSAVAASVFSTNVIRAAPAD